MVVKRSYRFAQEVNRRMQLKIDSLQNYRPLTPQPQAVNSY